MLGVIRRSGWFSVFVDLESSSTCAVGEIAKVDLDLGRKSHEMLCMELRRGNTDRDESKMDDMCVENLYNI